MEPNPYDPRLRTDLSRNEKTAMQLADECLHGDDIGFVDRHVSENYIQHTAGIGQGREGLRNYLRTVAWKRPGRNVWRPIHLFECGNFVILHKLLPAVVIVDLLRFDEAGMLIEHWDVVQPLPEPDYDPMRLSNENFARFAALFKMS